MIDTDKYEGHTPTEEWGDIVYADGYLTIFLDDDVYATDTDRQLMADAPLLLQEVKRLEDQTWQANADCVELEKEVKRLREAIEYDDLKKLQKMYASSMEERRLLREEVKRLSKITEYVKWTIDYHYHCIDNMTGGFIDWMVFATELHDMFYGDEEE